MFPLSFAIVFDEFPPRRSARESGWSPRFSGSAAASVSCSRGALVDYASWRWLFIVGALFVGVAAIGVWRFVPESPIKTPSKIDSVGALLLSGTLVALLLAMTEGPTWGWGSGRVARALRRERRARCCSGCARSCACESPMVDIRMMMQRTVLFTNLTAIFTGFAMFGAFVLLPSFMQTHRAATSTTGSALSPTATGLYLLPGGLLGFVAGPIAGRLGTRYGSRLPLILGMVLAASGSASSPCSTHIHSRSRSGWCSSASASRSRSRRWRS